MLFFGVQKTIYSFFHSHRERQDTLPCRWLHGLVLPQSRLPAMQGQWPPSWRQHQLWEPPAQEPWGRRQGARVPLLLHNPATRHRYCLKKCKNMRNKCSIVQCNFFLGSFPVLNLCSGISILLLILLETLNIQLLLNFNGPPNTTDISILWC